MTAPSPVLTFVDELVQDVAAEDMAPQQALAILRARGLNPDRRALDDAVQAVNDRDGLAGGLIDPLNYIEAEPRPGLHALDVATAQAEENLSWALIHLASRHIAVAS